MLDRWRSRHVRRQPTFGTPAQLRCRRCSISAASCCRWARQLSGHQRLPQRTEHELVAREELG